MIRTEATGTAETRFVDRIVGEVYPQLLEACHGSREVAQKELLRLLVARFAQAMRLPECPFLAHATRAGRQEKLPLDDGEQIDFAQLPVLLLGEVYERLLSADRSRRKAQGSYYTPQHIIDYLGEQTLGPAFERTGEMVQVLDPAMGTGHFLLAAARFLAERFSHREQALAFVVSKCLRGIDLDPIAVELARASLWLEAGGTLEVTEALRERIVCRDALLTDPRELGGPFDCILGNPPYGSQVEAAARKQMLLHLPQMRHNGDTAIGFLERCSQLLAPGGRCGLIVPKPLTYSFAWRHLRAFLGRRIEHVVDVSRAWPEVKLEQVLIVFGTISRSTSYRAADYTVKGFSAARRQPWRLAEQFQVLPCGLSAEEQRTLMHLRLDKATIGDVAKTWRGLPWQARMQEQGEIPLLGGRNLVRWRTRGASGYVAAPHLERIDEAFGHPKLLFQNIVAHVSRPQPHILLTGAYDAAGTLTLDTVNNLSPRDPRVPLHGLLALLHSQFVNWFVYAVIYNRAIRTMHFDQYFLDKIPLPAEHAHWWPQLAELACDAERNEQAIAQCEADLAIELRELGGVGLSAKSAAEVLSGRSRRHAALAEPHRGRAAALFARRAAIQAAIDHTVNTAYGLTDCKATEPEEALCSMS